MFKLNENFGVDRKILNSENKRFSPADTSTINTPNSQFCMNNTAEDSVISLLNSYLDLTFEVIKKADNSRCANSFDLRLVTLRLIALFGSFNLITSSGRRLEDISHAHIVCLLYQIKASAKDSNDMSIGFDRDRNRRREKLTNRKTIKCKFPAKNMLKDVFGCAEHHEKAIFGLCYKLTLTWNKDNSLLKKFVALVDARIKIDHIHWYVPHHTLSIQQQGLLFTQILSENTYGASIYWETSFYGRREETKSMEFWLGSQNNMSASIWRIIGFRQRYRQNLQILKNSSLCRLPVTSTQCNFETEK